MIFPPLILLFGGSAHHDWEDLKGRTTAEKLYFDYQVTP
jgi:hypothetical protein